jgi:hypothetical protein
MSASKRLEAPRASTITGHSAAVVTRRDTPPSSTTRVLQYAGASPEPDDVLARPFRINDEMALAWPLRSVLAGTAGTATMTLAYAAERRLRPHMQGPLDYDDSLVPGQIVASIMHLPHVTAREDRELGLILRWSYGSAFGLWHGALRRLIAEPWASVAFGGTLMSATLTLFPLLGRTPPPWRWPVDVLATSIGTHVAYVSAVAAVDDGIRRRASSL